MSDGIITECRDGETMNAAINIAMMGGILGTTLHADSVSLMIQRAIALCPPRNVTTWSRPSLRRSGSASTSALCPARAAGVLRSANSSPSIVICAAS
ncbi:hypothetical protein RAA17_24400 [Komagataeibacter rhaeticus]|nr:hypothetical protein [Komagataeibacter rhaeticus]